MTLLLALWLACAKHPAREPAAEPVADAEAEPAPPPVLPVTGPTTWSGGGVTLPVPDGWRGSTGPAGTPLLLQLTDTRTGVRFEVWAYPRRGSVGPRPREGCDIVFRDAGRYRAVPALPAAVTATCLPDAPDGPTVQGWYALVGEREIHLEVLYPSGRLISGRDAVEPLLLGLRTP